MNKQLIKRMLRLVTMMLALCATNAWAATANVVWESDFKAGSDTRSGWNLNLDASWIDEDGNLTIPSGSTGAILTRANGYAQHYRSSISILIEYENAAAGTQGAMPFSLVGNDDANLIGIKTIGTSDLTMIGNFQDGKDYPQNKTGSEKVMTTMPASGALLFVIPNGACQAYAASSRAGLSASGVGGSIAGLSFTCAKYYKIALGGPTKACTNVRNFAGLKIKKVAIFTTAISASDAASYKFPSEADYTATISANANWEDISWENNAVWNDAADNSTKMVHLKIPTGVTLTKDGGLSASNVALSGGGTLAFTDSSGSGATVSAALCGDGFIRVASGTVTFAADNRGIGCGFSVANGGNAKASNSYGYGPQYTSCNISVESGGAMDVYNVALGGYYITIAGRGIELPGGTYSGALYSSSNLGNGAAQLQGITLSGDATIRCDNTWGILPSGWNSYEGVISVGTHTLTKVGSASFWMCNVKESTTDTGTIKIVEGNITTVNKANTLSDNTLSKSTFEIANGATLNVNGSGLTIKTLTGHDGASIEVATGKSFVFTDCNLDGTVSYKGPISVSANSINIPSDATFKWVDTSWTSGNYFAGSGTLELMADSAQTDHTVAGSTFGGIVKLSNDSDGKQNNLKASETAAMFSNRPELIVNASSVHLGPNWNNNLEHPIQVRNLSGSGQLRGQWGSGTFNYLVETLQERDTAYIGTLGCDESGGNRYVSFSVIGDNSGEIHSLTITRPLNTGNDGGCRASTITVADDAKVVFTSDGKWGNGTIIVNEDGWLESTNTTAAANITLNGGSTVGVPYVNSATVPLGGTTVTLPTSGTVNVDLTGVSVAEGETVTVISATTLENANASIFHPTEGGWRFSVDNNTIKATKLGTATWSDGTWSDSDLTGYASASITASGTQDVTLPATTSFDTLTITGSGSITLKSTSSETFTVSALSIGSEVTLNASSSLVLAEGCAITGEGVLNIPANTTFAMNGVTCSTVSISGTGAISVPESTICSMEDVSLTGTTISGEGRISVPANTTCSMTNVTCSAKIIVAGTLATSGTTTLSGPNESTGTINVTGGVTTATFRGQYLEGTVNIASGAELVLTSSNPIFYNSPSSINIVVKGTLTVNNTMTIGTNTPISLYPGAIVRGSGLLSLGGSVKKASTIQMNAQGGDTSGIATISCRISTSADSSGAKIIVEDGVTLACSGTMSGANSIAKQGQGSLTIDAGTMVSTVEPTGQVTINENATFELKDCAWTSNVFSGSGTLYLHHTNTATDRYNHSVSGSSFSGRLKIGTPSGKTAYFNDNPETQLTGRPELVLELGTQGEQGQLWVGARAKDRYFKVKNLSGWGYVVPWSSEKGVHYFETVQNANTEFSGVFADWDGSDIGTGNYKTGLTVKGGDTVKSLTLTAANTTTGPLAIQDSGKVIFSGSGSWLNGTTTVKSGGVLESQRDAQVIGALALEAGSTLAYGNSSEAIKASGALTLPASGKVAVDVSDLTIGAGDSTTLLTVGSGMPSDVNKFALDSNTHVLSVSGQTLSLVPIAATLTKNDDTVVPFATVQEAVNATAYTGYKYITVNVNDSTVNAVDMTLKVKYGAGVSSFTVNSPSAEYAADGVVMDSESGIATYSLTLAATTYTWAATGEGVKKWTTPANWTYGSGTPAIRCPTTRDSVVFNAGANVTLDSTMTVAGIAVNGAVSISGSAKSLNTSGNITGEGTLTLSDICLASVGAELTVAPNINFTNDSELARVTSGKLILNGDITARGTFKVWDVTHTVNGNLSIASGVNMAIGSGLEVKGTTTFNGDFEKTGNGTLSLGAVNVVGNSAPTVTTGSIAIGGAITVGDGVTFTRGSITLASGYSFNGGGTATIVLPAPATPVQCTFANNWAGTIELPSYSLGAEKFNNYGNSNSKVRINGYSGWLNWTQTGNPNRSRHNPTLDIAGSFAITAMSQWDYTFDKVTGSGSMTFSSSAPNSITITELEVPEGFNGVCVTNNTSKALTIGTLTLPSLPTCDQKILSVGGTGSISLDISNIKVGEASLPAKYKLERRHKGEEDDGFYVYYNGTIFSVW